MVSYGSSKKFVKSTEIVEYKLNLQWKSKMKNL